MRYRGLILMIPLLLLAARAFAKEDSIKIITVYRDDFTRESLKPRVTIMNTDSVPLHVYMTTKYADNVKSWYMEATERLYDAYILKAELKGYETTYETISIQKEDRKRKVKELSGLLMQRSVTQLKEVAVEASKVLMVYKGDTIIYDATAFNLADGSMLDGLIRALPGATIENGKISVNGQHVSRLLINGRDFFRGDAKIALENLPAYYVQRIKSYHEISAERRMQEGDSVRVDPMKDALVMDVELKRDLAEGWTANAEAAHGTQDRNLFRLFAMRYTRHSGLYIFGNINNLNDTGNPDKEGRWGNKTVSEGIAEEKTVGIDFSLDTKKSKALFDSYAKLNIHNLNLDNKTSTEQYFSTGNTFGRNHTQNESRKTDVTWGCSYKYEGWKTGKKGSFTISPDFSYTYYRNTGLVQSANFPLDPKDSYIGASLDSIFAPMGSRRLTDILINRRENTSHGIYKTWSGGGNVGGEIPLRGSYGLGIYLHGHFTDKQAKMLEKDNVHYGYQSTEPDNIQNRYTRTPDSQYDLGAQISSPSFREGIFGGFVDYVFEREYSSGERSLYRLDWLREEDSETTDLDMLPPTDSLQKAIDIRNSYETVTASNTHTIRPQLFISAKKSNLTFSFPVLFYHRVITDQRNLQQREYVQNVSCIEPNIYFSSYFSNERSLSAQFGYQQRPPRLGYMLEVRDDSDPLNISLGNSALRNEEQFLVSIQGASRKPKRNRTQNIGFNYGLLRNGISMGKFYDHDTGITTYKPMNINGNWYMSGKYQYTSALDSAKRIFITSDSRINYKNSVDYVSDQADKQNIKNNVRTLRFGELIKLDFNLRKMRFSPKVRIELTHAESPTLGFSTVNAVDLSYGATFFTPLVCGMQFDTDLSVWSHMGYSDQSMNINEVQWNAHITYPLLKDKSLILKMTAYDILGQISNVRHVLNAQGRTEMWYNTLPRYFMFHVSYRFNKKPKERTKSQEV